MINSNEPYVADGKTVIIMGDHVPTQGLGGTVHYRYLLPGVYEAGEQIPQVVFACADCGERIDWPAPSVCSNCHRLRFAEGI